MVLMALARCSTSQSPSLLRPGVLLLLLLLAWLESDDRSEEVRRRGKGASTMKKSWSVFNGPALGMWPSRRCGVGEPSSRSRVRTCRAAMGATSMGMWGQEVRRRDCSLRWSGHGVSEEMEGGEGQLVKILGVGVSDQQRI